MRFAPDPTGTGPLVSQLAEDLHASGDQVTVVTSSPHYGSSDLDARYRGKLLVEENLKGVRVIRTAAILLSPGSRVGRALDYLAYTVLAIWGGMRAEGIDVILAVSPPITVSIPAAILSRVRRVPVVLNAQDIWPDGLIEMGKLPRGPWLGPLHWFERWSYRIAARVSVVSRGMKMRLTEKAKVWGTVSWCFLRGTSATQPGWKTWSKQPRN
jgi:hypothetical protein